MRVAVAVLIAVLSLAADANAGWFGFRNDMSHSIVLHATTDKAKPGRSLTLQPGESTCDWVNDAAVRKIVVLDGRDRRTELIRFEAVPASGDGLYVIRNATRDGRRIIEVVKTADSGGKKK